MSRGLVDDDTLFGQVLNRLAGDAALGGPADTSLWSHGRFAALAAASLDAQNVTADLTRLTADLQHTLERARLAAAALQLAG